MRLLIRKERRKNKKKDSEIQRLTDKMKYTRKYPVFAGTKRTLNSFKAQSFLLVKGFNGERREV